MSINPLRPEDSGGYTPDAETSKKIDLFIEAALREAQQLGLDEEAVLDQLAHVQTVHEPSAAERIAEHTGHNEWLLEGRIVMSTADISTCLYHAGVLEAEVCTRARRETAADYLRLLANRANKL